MNCQYIYIGGFDVVISCILEENHGPHHKSYIGQQWDDPVVASDSGI